MPVLHSIIHKIDKKPDGNPAILHYSGAELAESQARNELINQHGEVVVTVVGITMYRRRPAATA